MHQEFIQQIDFYLDENLRKIKIVWASLSEAEIWQRPNESCLAPANQLIHLSGNLRQWVGTALAGKPEVRTRDAEFAIREGKDKAVVLAHFVEEFAFAKTRLSQATQLLDKHTVQGHHTTEMGVWIHMAEHLSYHTGQLVYTAKSMRDIDFDFYGSWKLKE